MKTVLATFAELLALSLLVVFTAQTAYAIKPFETEFKAQYVKEDSSVATEKALAEAVAEVKCNVCHKGKKKKDLNAYGLALGELLDKKKDKKDLEKIRAALDKVAALKSDPSASDAPTFGDLIKEGKLPGGKE